MEDKTIGIVSLFSGCGGLDLGFEQVGNYKTLWANDFKHEACETFRHHFGNIIYEGDIEKIDPYTDSTIPNCDLILGGFPCQDFSIIWKQPGLNGERGNLYKSFLRFVDAKKPKAFVAENLETKCFLRHDEKAFWMAYILLQRLRMPKVLKDVEEVTLELLGNQINKTQAKNFARADEIRDQLAAEGIILEDTREGVKWKRA